MRRRSNILFAFVETALRAGPVNLLTSINYHPFRSPLAYILLTAAARHAEGFTQEIHYENDILI
jgi:hypothetical protein